jgi:hypothetical protein
MTLSTFPTFLTFLTFGLVRAGWLKLVTTKTGGRNIHRRHVNPLPFSGAPTPERSERSERGAPIMTLSTFPIFLTFLTQRLRVPSTWEICLAGLRVARQPWAADCDQRR